jgi:hypothetical protein
MKTSSGPDNIPPVDPFPKNHASTAPSISSATTTQPAKEQGPQVDQSDVEYWASVDAENAKRLEERKTFSPWGRHWYARPR